MNEFHTKSVALIGCGAWGKNIARVLSQLGALKLICDGSEPAASLIAAELGVEVTSDLDGTLRRSDISAVAIATPAVTHAQIAQSALNAGKHVYVEKPIALSVADARNLAATATLRGKVLMVGHLLQYHPGFMKLLDLIRSGALGKITYLYSNRLNPGRIRIEENVLWSLAPHDFSMLLALVGETPRALTATGSAIVQPNIPDVVTVHLSFPGGAKGHIFCSWISPYKEHKLTVIGDQAMAIFDDTPRLWSDKSLKLCHHKAAFNNGVPEFTKGIEQTILFEQCEPLKNELMHFLECVKTGQKPRTAADEAIPVLDALERAQMYIDRSET